ncbi:unnamed protein product [Protopolystoma xenopodis]|uniref:Uncharacterized protein n=1 Tax=Protopolystoma xenopodis TaxID=117903 RepID=A0A3S5B9H9_9PLAT|nr:unnamed protein product [Protopolystoma xenopodis]
MARLSVDYAAGETSEKTTISGSKAGNQQNCYSGGRRTVCPDKMTELRKSGQTTSIHFKATAPKIKVTTS